MSGRRGGPVQHADRWAADFLRDREAQLVPEAKIIESRKFPAPSPREAALIVVIEDEAIVLIGYQMLFESWGHSVIAASSAADALAQLEKSGGCPDLILADYRLRDGQTGVAAIRTVQNACKKAIPGILITGDTGAERLREAASSGLPILHKPVNGKQLGEILERHLSTRHGLGTPS